MHDSLHSVQPGDVIGFSGRSWLSAGINISTFGIPFWGISHVGIVGYAHQALPSYSLFESTGKTGVQSRNFDEAIMDYNGRVWLYQLSRPLFLHEMTRLMRRLKGLEGRPYDVPGAVRAGGAIWSLIQAVARGEDLTSLFCSEFVAEVLSYIGIFPTANASRWSPNHLVRKLRRMGIVNPPMRLK